MNTSSPKPKIQPASKKRWIPRIALSSILLLFIVGSLLFAIRKTRLQTDQLRTQLVGLRSAARELVVNDPTKYATVAPHPQWYGQVVFRVYVPDDSNYELCLATEGIPSVSVGISPDVFPKVRNCITISPGKHSIETKTEKTDSGFKITIIVDGEKLIEAEKPKEWASHHGTETSHLISDCKQQDTDTPLVLYYQTFAVEYKDGSFGPSKTPGNGVLLWIQRRQK